MKKILGIVLLCALVLVGCQNAPQSNGSQYKAVGYSDLAEPTFDATTNKGKDGPNEAFPGFKDKTILDPILDDTIGGTLSSLAGFYGGILGSADGSITSKSLNASVNLAIRDENMVMTDENLGTGNVAVDYLDARISANTDKLLPAIGQILSSLRPDVASKFENMEAMSGVNGDLFLNSRLLADYADKDGANGLSCAFSEYVNLHVRDLTVENSKNADDEPVTTVSGKVTSDPIHLTLAGTQIFYELEKNAYSYCIPWTISIDVAAMNLDLSKIFDTGDSAGSDPDASTILDDSGEPVITTEEKEAIISDLYFGGAKDMATFRVAFFDGDGNVLKEETYKNLEFFEFIFNYD